MGKSTAAKRDVFFRAAKEDGYRARSAYKLLHLDEQFNLFQNVQRVVDLCAAPGSWSQVLAAKLPGKLIVAVDLQPMAPLLGVIQLEGDITKLETAERIVELFQGGLADLVVCDGAPDVTGLHDLDEFVQAQLLLAALSITLQVLQPGGTFIAKIFRGKDVTLLYDQLRCYFARVTCAKPRSSRESSLEAFVVCEGFLSFFDAPSTTATATDGIQKSTAIRTLNRTTLELENDLKLISPFIACGDLSGFDSDHYPSSVPSSSRGDLPEPTCPPYR